MTKSVMDIFCVMSKDILSNIFIIDTYNIKYIINKYTNNEEGVRNIKRCIEDLFLKINLLRLIKAPTVRVDLGYLTNPGDAERLGRADFRNVIAESIVIAIQRLYLASEDDAKTGMLRLSDLRKAGLRSN
jgi:ATP-dependent Lon protease